MAKHIDADKLIAEIKRLIKVNQELKSSHFTEGIAAGYGDVLSAIDSLQQEQSEVDLKKIIEQTYHDGSVADTDNIDHVTYENIACYFYELGQKDAANKYDEIEYNRQRAEEESK